MPAVCSYQLRAIALRDHNGRQWTLLSWLSRSESVTLSDIRCFLRCYVIARFRFRVVPPEKCITITRTRKNDNVYRRALRKLWRRDINNSCVVHCWKRVKRIQTSVKRHNSSKQNLLTNHIAHKEAWFEPRSFEALVVSLHWKLHLK